MQLISNVVLFSIVTAVILIKPIYGQKPASCTGGQVWNYCGSACTKTCNTPSSTICTAQCVAKCQCPADKVWHNGQCIVKSSCPGKLTCTSCDKSYSPMPVCTRRVPKTCSRCSSSWWRRRCSSYDCSYNQNYCSCPGYKIVGKVCQTECGGCDNTGVKDQQACLHKTQKTKPYCCEAFHLEDIGGQPRCKTGKCGGTGVPFTLK